MSLAAPLMSSIAIDFDRTVLKGQTSHLGHKTRKGNPNGRFSHPYIQQTGRKLSGYQCVRGEQYFSA